MFVPMLSQSVFSLPITKVYKPAALDMEYPDPLKECEKVFDCNKVSTHYMIITSHEFVINFSMLLTV